MANHQATPPTQTWLQHKATWAAGAVLLAAALGVIYVVKPDGVWFFPQCLFHLITGLDCPGCGATRAVHRLLHGQVVEAWQFNPLFVSVLLPVLLYWLVRYVWFKWHRLKWDGRVLPNWALATLGVVVVVFGLVRNLPSYPYKTSELSRRQQSPGDDGPTAAPTLMHLP